jgi:hypothetical protein
MADNKLDIKKGHKYQCYNLKFDGFMFAKNEIIGFTVGDVYTSHKDGFLKNDDGIEMTFFHDAAEFFRPVVEKKRNKKKKF